MSSPGKRTQTRDHHGPFKGCTPSFLRALTKPRGRANSRRVDASGYPAIIMGGEYGTPPRKPPALQLLRTPPKELFRNRGDNPPASSYPPQTPVLKGKDAVSHAVSNLGTCLFGAGQVVLGVMCFYSPSSAAATYGLTAAEGWVQANGMRDIVIGIATMALHISHRAALRVWLPLCMLVPLSDCFVVAAWGGGLSSGAAQVRDLLFLRSSPAFLHPLVCLSLDLSRCVPPLPADALGGRVPCPLLGGVCPPRPARLAAALGDWTCGTRERVIAVLVNNRAYRMYIMCAVSVLFLAVRSRALSCCSLLR